MSTRQEPSLHVVQHHIVTWPLRVSVDISERVHELVALKTAEVKMCDAESPWWCTHRNDSVQDSQEEALAVEEAGHRVRERQSVKSEQCFRRCQVPFGLHRIQENQGQTEKDTMVMQQDVGDPKRGHTEAMDLTWLTAAAALFFGNAMLMRAEQCYSHGGALCISSEHGQSLPRG